jgi:hypothetical protein
MTIQFTIPPLFYDSIVGPRPAKEHWKSPCLFSGSSWAANIPNMYMTMLKPIPIDNLILQSMYPVKYNDSSI